MISLAHAGDQLIMRITDDGNGFEVEGNTSGRSGHFGCIGMRERCRKIGAEVSWESSPGQGTSVVVTLPLGEKGGRA